MATGKQQDAYKVELTGPGVSVKRDVSETVAHQIVTLVMGGGARSEQQGLMQGGAGSEGRFDATTAKAFMTSKRPSSDMEKVTCLAYHLSHHKKIAAFKTKELSELNIEAAQQKLSNPSATARNAVAQGFLSLAGGGRKQITSRGEALVQALPDRDKVRDALAAHPIRKPRKRREARKT